MSDRQAFDTPDQRVSALRDEYNDLIDGLGEQGVLAHYDRAPEAHALVTAADASDLATSKTLTLDIVNKMVTHGASTKVHSAADAALDVPAAASSHPNEPADLAEVGATLNELKGDLNTHLANATPHRGVGGEGGHAPAQVSTSDFSSTQAEANTLANALKAAFNRHVQSGAQKITLVAS